MFPVVLRVLCSSRNFVSSIPGLIFNYIKNAVPVLQKSIEMDHRGNLNRKRNPREVASLLSHLTFAYTIGLFYKGFRKDIEEEDLYEVTKECRSKENGDRMEDEWNRLRKENEDPSIYKLIWNLFGIRYFLLGFVQLGWKIFTSYMKPNAVGKVVSYFSNTPGKLGISHEDAIFYGCVLMTIELLHGIYTPNYQLILQTLAMKIRISFSSMIYRKSLKLSPSALSDISLGNIMTLVTKDVRTFENSIWLINDLWISCVEVSVICYLIYTRMGWPSFVGVSILCLVIPVQIFMAKVITQTRLKVNKKTDERLQITQETLSAIKIIKMYTWEMFFDKKIEKTRYQELKRLLKTQLLRMGSIIIGVTCSKTGLYFLIMTYIWLGYTATAELISYITVQYHTLQFSIGVAMPLGFARIAELVAAIRRLTVLLKADELIQITNEEDDYPKKYPKVDIIKASVFIKDKKIIDNVSLTLKPGLTIVTGHLGCGKSNLLKAILRDNPLKTGTININGRISYASQDAWLFPSSIKQNILFGQGYSEYRYKEVVKVCSLEFDFDILENKDETIVADRGINLSGGQQARINLARAIYKDSEIYLLDDSLTALDPKVQDQIFYDCIQGYLKGKIVVLVTHNKSFIDKADKLVILDNGAIKYIGKPEDINETKVIEYLEEEETQKEKKMSHAEIEKFSDEKSKLLEAEKEVEKKNIYKEIKKTGSVNFDVYIQYIKYGGGLIIFSIILTMFIGNEAADSFSSKLLSKWVNLQQNLTNLRILNQTNSEFYNQTAQKNTFTINLYSGLLVAGSVLEVIKLYFFFSFCMIASRNIHNTMISNIVNACMSFFDNYFIGNILNRCSQDMFMTDENLVATIMQLLRILFLAVGVTILIASVSMRFMILALVFMTILVCLRYFYIPTGRSLKRLEASTKSPFIGHLNASLEGMTTIRAYKAQNALIHEFDKHQDVFSSAYYIFFCTQKAFAFFMEMVSACFVSLIVCRYLFIKSNAEAGDVGLAIQQCLHLTLVVRFGVHIWSELENTMTSVERLLEYMKLPQEVKEGQVVENWPSKGAVEYQNVSMSYSKSNEKVLKNMSFKLEAQEKIGIVGRTGAGKSTIIATLFRLYDFEGKILIDHIDTKTLTLESLRQHIAIIPQCPILFAGTMRTNVDPYGLYTDDDIWNALENAKIKNDIPSLDMEIHENDPEFSTGQRQLICLARAIVRKNKIVVLDEATANMDPATETMIQTTINECFQHCTVFVIAHRLQSVLECNKVMVMDRGEIKEFGEPLVLVEDKNSTFHTMVKQAGLLKEE